MSKVIYLTDRSRIVAREDCERKRFINYDFDVDGEPTGIERTTTSLPLLNGIEIHEAHAKVLAGQDIDTVVAEMVARYTTTVNERGVHVYDEDNKAGLIAEQTALLDGMLRGFVLVVLPRILEEYDVVTIEKPMDWELAPGLVQKLRFDAVLRRKGDGQLVILDYKSMAYISDAWEKKLERSRQTSLYVLAAEELFGEPVEIAYVGMVKGQYAKDTAKSSPFYGQRIQKSPYVYAYGLVSADGGIYQAPYTPKKGYVKLRIPDAYEGGTKAWVDYLWHNDRNSLNELFTFIPPFAPTRREMHRVKELVVREELAYLRRIKNYRAMVAKANGDSRLLQQAQDYLDFVAAPMREERCYQYGEASACAYVGICFNEGGFEHALADGGFEPRKAHHNTELEEAA